MARNGYPWRCSALNSDIMPSPYPQVRELQFVLGWNALELPEYLAIANGIGGQSSSASSELSPRSCLELAFSVGRHSPYILPATTNPAAMNERSGASNSSKNQVQDAQRNVRLGASKRSTMENKEVPICFDFVQGKCHRQNCKYQHDFGAVIRHNSKETRICFDHLRGECSRGSLCRFSHNLKPLITQSLEDGARGLVQTRANGICYDFCRGACPRRGTCPWTHNLVEIAWSTAKQPLLQEQKFTILKQVVNVVLATCPQFMSETEIIQILQQSMNAHSKSVTLQSTTTSPMSGLGPLDYGMNLESFGMRSMTEMRSSKHPKMAPFATQEAMEDVERLLDSLEHELTSGLDLNL
eukprot:g383.t1